VTLEDVDRNLRKRLQALSLPAARAELLHVLRLRLRTRRSDRRVLGSPGDADLGDLLIDLEEDKAARAVVFGLLR
jgi:hypothetical protein